VKLIEGVAAGLTLASVALATVRSAWCWAFGAMAVICYFVVFLDARLYANMALQIVYFALQCYGGFQWIYRKGPEKGLPTHATLEQTLIVLLIGLISTGIIGAGLSGWTNTNLPFVDSASASFSLIAVWLLARKVVENWLMWSIINLIYIPTFWSKELYFSFGLYIVLLGFNIFGYLSWLLAVKRNRAVS
jgi:nicotinamide mononucleotide transporter